MNSTCTENHAFRARFGYDVLRLFERTFQLGGPLYVETTDDELTVGSANPEHTLSVTATVDAAEFDTYEHVTPGTTIVRDQHFHGLRSILQAADDADGEPFELTVDPEHLALTHTDSMLGGHAPRESVGRSPVDIASFEHKLTCEATVKAPAAVESLYHAAECAEQDAHAELTATDGEAYLAMAGDNAKRATLGNPVHRDDHATTARFDADYVRTAFDCLAWQNNGTRLRWGDTVPLVLEMDAKHRQFRAVVAPRLGEDLDDAPLHETAGDLRSVGAATAGGFR